MEFDEGFLSAVAGRDILSLLMHRLKEPEQRILRELANGLSVCEVAAKLKVSHVLVLKRRRVIAKLAIKLGINPRPASPNSHA